MPSEEPLTACHEHINAEAFRQPSPSEIRKYSPCKFCFPGGEVTVDDDDLLIAVGTCRRRCFHRRQATDGANWSPESSESRCVARVMRRDDVRSIADLQEKLGGESA